MDPFAEQTPTLQEMIAMLKSTVRAEMRADDREVQSSGIAPMSLVEVFGPKPAPVPSRAVHGSRRHRGTKRPRAPMPVT